MSTKPVVLITGGSGMVGRHLTSLLKHDYEVIWLVRKANAAHPVKQYIWDVENTKVDETALKHADYIIHLAGHNLAQGRWTTSNKKKILDSRVMSSQLLEHRLNTLDHQVKAIICASAIGIYEDKGAEWQDEQTTSHASDFLAEVVRQWEQANNNFPVRTVLLRTGIVLDKKEGAFPQLMFPMYTGVAPIFNGGVSYQSWIHLDDLCNMYKFALEHQELSGVYNAVAPVPVTNAGFMKTLQKEVKWPTIRIPVPAFVLKMILGEKAIVVLKGGRISSKKIISHNFQFKYPELDSAIRNILSK